MWNHPRFLKLLVHGHRIRNIVGRRKGSQTRLASDQRGAFYEQAWREAASRLDATVESLGDGILEIRLGDAVTRVCRNETPLDDPITLAVAGNKPLVYRLLANRNLPINDYCVFRLEELSKAWSFCKRLGRTCVVKPASGAAGRGVTTGVDSYQSLARAAVAAAVISSELLIEEQTEGDVYRLLYLDGVLLDAVVRKPPTVTGDGKSTVRELIESTNRERLASGNRKAQVLIPFDMEMRQTLRQQQMSLNSVPAAGQIVVAKRVVNDNAGSENLPAAHLLSSDVIREGAEAAHVVRARLAGVDVITRDPGRPLAESKGVILEVNTTPGYYHHYHQLGARKEVALEILGTLLKCDTGYEHVSSGGMFSNYKNG
jgi:D-alanine-D-alanine ligase-like ATP-grasp enzyme